MFRSVVPSAVVLLSLALPGALAGQSRASGGRDTVPLGMLPPAGKCRIWMAGVPAAQQPAPTDCATALRQRPGNGTILYGPASRETGASRFDQGVGGRSPSRAGNANDSMTRGGSNAEREQQRRRDEAARRTRTWGPADARAGGATTTSAPKPAAEPATKPPAEPAKKKPE